MPFSHPALERTSFSALNSYLECGEKYRRKKILGHPEVPGWALVGGKAVHEVTERYDWHVIQGGAAEEFNWELEFQFVFNRMVTEETANSGVTPDQWRVSGKATTAWPDKETPEFWASQGPKFARTWGAWRAANPGYQFWVDPDGQVGIEAEFLIEFGGTPVLAFVDRIMTLGDDLAVIDIKSGRTMPENILQLELYASCVDLKYGVRPTLGGFYDARKGRMVHMEQLGGAIGTMDVVELVDGFITQAETGVFLPKPGRQCTYCSYRHNCAWAQSLTFGLRPKKEDNK